MLLLFLLQLIKQKEKRLWKSWLFSHVSYVKDAYVTAQHQHHKNTLEKFDSFFLSLFLKLKLSNEKDWIMNPDQFSTFGYFFALCKIWISQQIVELHSIFNDQKMAIIIIASSHLTTTFCILTTKTKQKNHKQKQSRKKNRGWINFRCHLQIKWDGKEVFDPLGLRLCEACMCNKISTIRIFFFALKWTVSPHIHIRTHASKQI